MGDYPPGHLPFTVLPPTKARYDPSVQECGMLMPATRTRAASRCTALANWVFPEWFWYEERNYRADFSHRVCARHARAVRQRREATYQWRLRQPNRERTPVDES